MASEEKIISRSLLAGGHSIDDQISDREFRLFRKLIQDESGICLEQGKKAFLVRRLGRRLKANDLQSFNEYFQLLSTTDGAVELPRMLDAITTNETSFFRDTRQFDYLKETLIPELEEQASTRARPRHLRIWSASCATGEEPYSLAMLFTRELPSNWLVRVSATDIDESVLETARKATYEIQETRSDSREVPQELSAPWSG